MHAITNNRCSNPIEDISRNIQYLKLIELQCELANESYAGLYVFFFFKQIGMYISCIVFITNHLPPLHFINLINDAPKLTYKKQNPYIIYHTMKSYF